MKKQLLFILAALIVSCSANAQMVLEFNTNLSDGKTITLPLYGAVNVTVNWGDSKTDNYTTADDHKHEYAAEGTYTVSISGSLEKFGKYDYPNADKLVKVTTFGNIGLSSLANAFYNAINLIELPTILPSTVTSLEAMLRRASKFNFDIGGWNVSNVNKMFNLFREASSFNQNIGGWDVSKVSDMGYMFDKAILFNRDISSWNVSKVYNMFSMFSNAESFNQNIGGWNVSKVTDMGYMFRGARAFNQDISRWNVSGVYNMNNMFASCESFNQDISNWDVSRVTNMSEMFMEATSFNQNIGKWNVSSATNMSYMFKKAAVFNQSIGGWDVSKVTNMSAMFQEATAFNQDISGWDVSKVTDMRYMFSRAAAFNQNIGGWDVSKVIDMEGMFGFATAFNQDIGGWDVSKVLVMNSMFAYATLFNQDIGRWNVSSVGNMGAMFRGTTLSTTIYNKLLIGWAGQTVKNGVSFEGGYSKYSLGAAADARAVLTGTYEWKISDGGISDESGVASTIADNIGVYPNPFHNEIRLSNARDASRIVITNVLGKVVLDQSAKQIIETNLPSGIYLFTIIANDGSKVQRKMMRE